MTAILNCLLPEKWAFVRFNLLNRISCANSLHTGWVGGVYGYILIGDDREIVEDTRNKFSPFQEVLWVARPAECFIASGECFV